MIYSMNEAFQVVLPHLPSELASFEAVSNIQKVACSLPPVYWGGFECRLEETASQVDFHQGIEPGTDTTKFLNALPPLKAIKDPRETLTINF